VFFNWQLGHFRPSQILSDQGRWATIALFFLHKIKRLYGNQMAKVGFGKKAFFRISEIKYRPFAF
jgi:hypothetical protein